MVKYRLLREEVASIVEETVRTTLNELEKSQDLRPLVVPVIIKSLERDPSWVSMYNITGEIDVPETKPVEEEIANVLTAVKEVTNGICQAG